MTPELTMPMIYAKIGRQHAAAVVVCVRHGGKVVDLMVSDQFNQSFLAQNVLVVEGEAVLAQYIADYPSHYDICWIAPWVRELPIIPASLRKAP